MAANWKTDLIPTYGSNPAMVDGEFCQSVDLCCLLEAHGYPRPVAGGGLVWWQKTLRRTRAT